MTLKAKKLFIILICAVTPLLIAAAVYLFMRSREEGAITLVSNSPAVITLEQVKPAGNVASFVTSDAVHVRAEYIVPKNDFDDSASCLIVAEEHAKNLLLNEVASLLDEKTGVKSAGITKDMIPALAAAALTIHVEEDVKRCFAEVSANFEPLEMISDMLKVLSGPFNGRDSIETRERALSALNGISNMTNGGDLGGDAEVALKTRYMTLVNELRFARFFEAGIASRKYGGISRNALTEAIKADPNSAYAFYYRSISQYEAKEALNDLTEAIRLAPDNYLFYYARGNIVQYSSKEMAIEDFSNAIRLNPDNEAAYMARGKIYAELGKYDLAVRDFEKMLVINPEKVQYYNQRGVYYLRDNNFARALDDFNSAINLSPNEAALYYNRGSAYQKLGARREAILDFQKAIELGGYDAEAEKHLEELLKQ
jgi:tetratricopeptide (TPR) repeat protein